VEYTILAGIRRLRKVKEGKKTEKSRQTDCRSHGVFRGQPYLLRAIKEGQSRARKMLSLQKEGTGLSRERDPSQAKKIRVRGMSGGKKDGIKGVRNKGRFALEAGVLPVVREWRKGIFYKRNNLPKARDSTLKKNVFESVIMP